VTAPGVADAKLSTDAAQVLYAYARAVDSGDLDTLEAIAHEDVALTRFDGTKHGRAAFLDLYRGFRDSDKQGSQHVVSNVQAFPEDGGQVRIHAYFQATMFEAGGTRVVIGRYEDSLRDDGDGLRFAHKRITVERVVELAASSSDWVGVTPKSEG
jgi:3-phenylpropionate/cinnamic acid dioxygenase small subunit